MSDLRIDTIKAKVQQLRAENLDLMNRGNIHQYQFNCAKLEGIAYVMGVLNS